MMNKRIFTWLLILIMGTVWLCMAGGVATAASAKGHAYQQIGKDWVHFGMSEDGRYTYRLTAKQFNSMMKTVATDTYADGPALGVWLWGTSENDNANYFIDDVRLVLVTENKDGSRTVELLKEYTFDDGISKGGGAPGALVYFDPEVCYGDVGYSLHITNRTSFTRSYRMSGLTGMFKELGTLEDNQYLALDAYVRADSDEEPIDLVPIIFNFYSDYGSVYLETYFEQTLKDELYTPPTSSETTVGTGTTTASGGGSSSSDTATHQTNSSTDSLPSVPSSGTTVSTESVSGEEGGPGANDTAFSWPAVWIALVTVAALLGVAAMRKKAR